jgi:hypothetical protein
VGGSDLSFLAVVIFTVVLDEAEYPVYAIRSDGLLVGLAGVVLTAARSLPLTALRWPEHEHLQMLWSRKGVPGSERSGGAGTPFLEARRRAKSRERAGGRLLAGVPRRESGAQLGTRERHAGHRRLRPNRPCKVSGRERVVGRLRREGDEV